jgi:GT2 family glycosyltransferase
VNRRSTSSRWQRRLLRTERSLYFAIDRARLLASRIRARWRARFAAQVPITDLPVTGTVIRPHEDEAGYPAFRSEDSPAVSIVIPVYNQLAHTARCLRALARTGAQCTFEVVVVDDGSSDGSAEWLAACPQVHVHRMPRNSGFVHACNAGAGVARGRYLVFLNNDTEVAAGWLDALIATFDALPKCGLVGAKLVYPDGSLQEAGGIVFDDGNACNYGRGGDPADPRYNFVREVDYCSGACIVLPRELFHSIGGFDTRYAPAYYEDTDLAFAVRAAGYQVIYQPLATVIHFEGQTAGTDPDSGTKRFQRIHRETFAAKWRHALSGQPAVQDFARSPERCATHWRGRHVLVVDADYPHADRDSGSLRMLNMLLLLRELGCHVLFWATAVVARDDAAGMLEQHGIELVTAFSREQALQWWYARGDRLDVVLLSRLPVASNHLRPARRYAAQASVIFDTVDLHFLRIARGAVLSGNSAEAAWAEELRGTELGLVRTADMTLVVSEYERNLLHELVPGTDVRVLSNIHPVHGRESTFAERQGLLFLGNFEHQPNIDAARWLIGEIMPPLRARLPGVKLHVVGYAGDKALAGYGGDNVQVHGYVADIEPILRHVRVALAPLRYGAGVKGKINMAMSHGVPVVTTTIGAEGMDLVNRRDALIADDVDSFADAVVALHGDERLWFDLSEQGLANVRRHFSPEAARDELERIVSGAAGASTRSE